MAEAPRALDAGWLRDHSLPRHDGETDKNSRGHVMAIGGSRQVPGALLLTIEAALRAGAGKVQMATIESGAHALGIAMPEAGVIALGETERGEIDAVSLAALERQLDRCDSIVLGPGITSREAAGALLATLLLRLENQPLLVDAVVLHAASEHREALRCHGGPLVITPNPDELASLLDRERDEAAANPDRCAGEAAMRYEATIVAKGEATVIAAPGGAVLRYPGGGVGLATGGSGDVLAGIIAALLARGADPLVAAGWGVWLHGEAGRRLAAEVGPVGFLARELAPRLPRLMHELAR